MCLCLNCVMRTLTWMNSAPSRPPSAPAQHTQHGTAHTACGAYRVFENAQLMPTLVPAVCWQQEVDSALPCSPAGCPASTHAHMHNSHPGRTSGHAIPHSPACQPSHKQTTHPSQPASQPATHPCSRRWARPTRGRTCGCRSWQSCRCRGLGQGWQGQGGIGSRGGRGRSGVKGQIREQG